MKISGIVSTLAFGAALVVGMNSPAFAAWEPIQLGEPVETSIFRAVTAGKSGNVKECYESQVIITTYQWTHTQTGKTRGTFDESEVIDEVQVDKSDCQ